MQPDGPRSILRTRLSPENLPKHPLLPMPTYDYECQTCGHQFEAKQSMKDPHLTDCPVEACAGPVKRKIGVGAGFIFKGTGFYITDYRSEGYQKAAKADSGASSSGSSSTSTATAPAKEKPKAGKKAS